MNEAREFLHSQRMAHIGSWYWNIDSGEYVASAELCRIFHRDAIPPFAEQAGLLYSDVTWKRLNEAVQLALVSGTGYDIDMPALCGDGCKIWVHSICEAECSPSGKVLGLRGTIQDITRRRQAAVENRLKAELLDAVGQATIATDSLGNITYLNRAAEKLYGWQVEEVMGKAMLEAALPNINSTQSRQILERLASGLPWAGEFLVQQQNGKAFPAEVLATQILDESGAPLGLIGVFSDLRDRKRIEAALQLERSKLEAAFENPAVGLVVSNADGSDITINSTASRLFGFTSPEQMGNTLEEQRELWEASYEDGKMIPFNEMPLPRAVRGEYIRQQTIHLRNLRTGKSLVGDMTTTPVRDAKGQVVRLLLTIIDISETKRLDQALRHRNAELERAIAVAEEANQAKSLFLSRMSHELRTPMHTILGFAQLMDGDDPPPTLAQTASVEQILKSGWYLLELINEILDLAQVESGSLVVANQPISLTEVMRECRAMMVPQGRKQGVQVSFPESSKTYFVLADRTRAKQVLLNLLSNAIKYNRDNGSVVVSCEEREGGDGVPVIRVSVIDSGVGLTADSLRHLFEPFNRLGREHTETEGTGIGLAMSKRLVELMGGRIGAESSQGKGSTFWFELEATDEPRPDSETPTLVTRSLVNTADQEPAHTILYVEDNDAARRLMDQLFRRHLPNMRLLCASDGKDGLHLAQVMLPSVILLDIHLPGLSGTEVLHLLRQDPKTSQIPVLALSANAMPRDIELGMAAGFFRYLSKPVKIITLLEALEQALEFRFAAES